MLATPLLCSHQSPYLATSHSLLSHRSPSLFTHLPAWPPISQLSHPYSRPSPYLVTCLSLFLYFVFFFDCPLFQILYIWIVFLSCLQRNLNIFSRFSISMSPMYTVQLVQYLCLCTNTFSIISSYLLRICSPREQSTSVAYHAYFLLICMVQ